MKIRNVAIVLAVLLGIVGVHRFYLKQWKYGLAYLLFCWTLIPLIIGIVDAFIWAFWKIEKWDNTFNNGESSMNYINNNTFLNNPKNFPTINWSKEYPRKTHFYPNLAGFQYNDAPKLLDKLTVGTEVKLIREPKNPYDEKAIKVMFEEHIIGHLPKEYANSLYKQFDKGDKFEATISKYEPYQDDFHKITLELIDYTYMMQVRKKIK